jgi:hypothetical protein
MNEADHRWTLTPRPEVAYPVPWRLGEADRGVWTIVCAGGHHTAEVPTQAAAEIIVAAVNRYYDTLGEMGYC